MKTKIGIIGSGSWATAITKMLCENLDTIHWWVRNEYIKGYIEHHYHNPSYLSSVEFNTELLHISCDINEVVSNSDILILATPSIYIEDALKPLTVPLKGKKVISAIKGLVPSCDCITHEYISQQYQVPEEDMGVICGPCHAEEVAMERLSYITVATRDTLLGENLQQILESDFIKVSLSKDVVGTEYASVLKNIFAIAAGLAHGLGYGDNFNAVLISNAIREMKRFMKIIEPLKRNINESAYLGDLLVTAYSFFSRNRMLGNMIGKGYTVKSAILEMQMVAEGYYATKGIYQKSIEHDIDMPITQAVYKILIEEKNPKKIMEKLAAQFD